MHTSEAAEMSNSKGDGEHFAHPPSEVKVHFATQSAQLLARKRKMLPDTFSLSQKGLKVSGLDMQSLKDQQQICQRLEKEELRQREHHLKKRKDKLMRKDLSKKQFQNIEQKRKLKGKVEEMIEKAEMSVEKQY